MEKLSLLGDFGGTNARLALSTKDGPAHIHEYRCANFDDPAAIVRAYLDSQNIAKTDHAVIAVAGPADDPANVIFTNGPWKQKNLNFTAIDSDNVVTLNDFAAVCYSVALLQPGDCEKIYESSEREAYFPSITLNKNELTANPSRILESDPAHRFVAIGPGTGLGVGSGLVTKNNQFLVLGGEGGHASFSPDTDDEYAVKKHLEDNDDIVVTKETMASGTGMVKAYNAIAQIRKIDSAITESKELTELVTSTNKGIREAAYWTLSVFAKTLGSCASSSALTNNARTVFIAGGVVPKLHAYFDRMSFAKAYISNDLKANNILMNTPVVLMRHAQPGLLGAHAYLNLSK